MSFSTMLQADEADNGIELTTTQVANLIGVDRATVYTWVVSGRVPSRLGEKNRRWIRVEYLPQLRQMRRGAKPCQQCRLLASLLLQWGDTALVDLAAVAELDVGAVRDHLDDLAGYGFVRSLGGGFWRITPSGVCFADGEPLALMPMGPDESNRSIDQLERLPEYLMLARIIASRGPISAAAASVGTQLNENQALRRARRLARARLIFRPRPRLWAITPQGRAWLDKHDGIDADAPAVRTAMST